MDAGLGLLVTVVGCGVLAWWSASGIEALVAETWPEAMVLQAVMGAVVWFVIIAWAGLSIIASPRLRRSRDVYGRACLPVRVANPSSQHLAGFGS
jgi:hypothetical protein